MSRPRRRSGSASRTEPSPTTAASSTWSNDAGATRVVNDLRVEDYLRGVVPKEISASWAVAGSRSGCSSRRGRKRSPRARTGSSRTATATRAPATHSRVRCTAESATRTVATGTATLVEDFRTDQAIAATAGVVRVWPNGSVVSTEFSASNGPRTAGGAFPAVDDAPGDSTQLNPNHRWTRVLDADALAAQYGIGALTVASMVEAAVERQYQQFDGIWFNDIVLTGTGGSRSGSNAWDFRGSHGFPSPGFTVRVITRDSLGTNVAVIGDSVGESAEGRVPHAHRRHVRRRSRSTRSSAGSSRRRRRHPSGVQVAAGVPTNLDLVVVELGYNPSTNMAADIDAMMTALNQRGTKRVVWVNMADVEGELRSGERRARAGARSLAQPRRRRLERGAAPPPASSGRDGSAPMVSTSRPPVRRSSPCGCDSSPVDPARSVEQAARSRRRPVAASSRTSASSSRSSARTWSAPMAWRARFLPGRRRWR